MISDVTRWRIGDSNTVDTIRARAFREGRAAALQRNGTSRMSVKNSITPMNGMHAAAYDNLCTNETHDAHEGLF